MVACAFRFAWLAAIALSLALEPAVLYAAAADTGSTKSHGSGPDPLSFDPDLAIFTAIVFILLLLVLAKFAWKPLIHAFDQREHRIAENIAAAERVGEEARRTIAQYEAKLAGAADEVRALLEEARRDAEHTKTQIVAEGKQAAQVELERATREIQTATDAALKQLGELSANLAVELAGKIIRQKLNPQEHQALIHEAVKKFAATEPSRN